MFLVELAHKTIVKKIDDLETKKKRTFEALQASKTNLHADSEQLRKFIDDDQQETTKKEKDADAKTQRRKEVERELKELDHEIGNLTNEIDKNHEQLSQFEGHKGFLLELYSKDQEAEAHYQSLVEKRQWREKKLMRDWIDRNRHDPNAIEEFFPEMSQGIGHRGKR